MASATASISTAGTLKMISPATMAGSKAIPVTRSSGSVAGLKAARSSQAPILLTHEPGGLALSSRDPPDSTLGIVGKEPPTDVRSRWPEAALPDNRQARVAASPTSWCDLRGRVGD